MPRTYLINHSGGDFQVAAFLGHDSNFSGADQSLRIDLFNITNCNWIAGIATNNGEISLVGDTQMAPENPADLNLYVEELPEGSYVLTLSEFKEGDYVDLVFSSSCVKDNSVTLENVLTGTGTMLPILGPSDIFDLNSNDIFDMAE